MDKEERKQINKRIRESRKALKLFGLEFNIDEEVYFLDTKESFPRILKGKIVNINIEGNYNEGHSRNCLEFTYDISVETFVVRPLDIDIPEDLIFRDENEIIERLKWSY